MDPKFLLIEDFMSHKSTSIDFDKFQSALIMGQHKSDPRESNGVGKTTIFHAIEYVLFGTYPTKTVDKIVRDGTSMAKVTFSFTIGSSVYKIVRKRILNKSTEVGLWLQTGTEWENKSQRTPSETHALIQNLIKINVSSFKNSVQFSQNSLDGLVASKGKEASIDDRKNILKDAINLSEYQKYEKLAKNKTDDLSRKIDARKMLIESIGDPQLDIDNLKNKIIEIKKVVVEKENKKKELSILIDGKKKELYDLQRLISSDASNIHEKINDIKNSKNHILENIKTTQASIIDGENKISLLLNKQNKSVEDLKDLEDRCDNIRAKKRRPINKVKQELESVTQNELNGKAYISSLERKISELRRPIPDGQECPMCRQTLTNEYKDSCQIKIKEELDTFLNDLADKKPKLKKCTNKKIKLQNEIEEINKAISYINSLETKIESKKQEISNDNDYILKLKELNEHKKSELNAITKQLQELEDRELKLQDALKDVSDDDLENKIIKVKNKITELEYLQHEVVEDIHYQNSQLEIFNARIEDKQDSLNKLNEEKKTLTNLDYEYQLYKRVKRAFHSSGIPTMIIHSILDDLQIETNNILTDLKPGLEIQFTPDIDLLYKYHGRERDFSQLSEGQKFMIALSFKLGLSLIIQKRLGVYIKLLQLDEVDQPLDEAAVDAYAEAIRKLQSKFKILVITHNNALKDKFSNVILVDGDENNGATSKLMSF